MDRPPFEQMTKQEKLQLKAGINQFLGIQLAEAETNRKRMEAEQLIELKEIVNED